MRDLQALIEANEERAAEMAIERRLKQERELARQHRQALAWCHARSEQRPVSERSGY